MKQHLTRQSGFSMMETLIAMVVFSVGFLGVTQYTGNALKRSADDSSRAISISTMTQLLTPLYVAASQGPTEFKNALDVYTSVEDVTVTGDKAVYIVKILQAQDDAGNSIIDSATPENWISPITVGVTVSYSGSDCTMTSQAPYTFLINN